MKQSYIFIGIAVMAIILISDTAARGPAPVVAKVEVEKVDLFKEVTIEAKAAYVYDLTSGAVLYAKNENVPLPLASITKLMTAWLALSRAPENTAIVIGPESIKRDGDSGLRAGEVWELRPLVEFTLTASSNDGAHALASAVGPFVSVGVEKEKGFITAMNEEARRLGLPGMYFLDSTGLDYGDNAGAYGSAKEVALFMAKFLAKFPEILEATAKEKLVTASLSAAHTAENTNKAAGAIPGLLGSKTGFTDVAGGNLVIAFDAGFMRPVIVVVLGSSEASRFDDVKRLVALSIESLSTEAR